MLCLSVNLPLLFLERELLLVNLLRVQLIHFLWVHLLDSNRLHSLEVQACLAQQHKLPVETHYSETAMCNLPSLLAHKDLYSQSPVLLFSQVHSHLVIYFLAQALYFQIQLDHYLVHHPHRQIKIWNYK